MPDHGFGGHFGDNEVNSMSVERDYWLREFNNKKKVLDDTDEIILYERGIRVMYNYFEEIMRNIDDKKIICFGAGNHGRKFVSEHCVETNLVPMPSYFCDNNKSKWGATLSFGDCEIKICNPQVILDESPNEVVIIVCAVWLTLVEQLKQMGCYYYPILSSHAVEAYFYFSENRNRVRKVQDSLEDDVSKDVYQMLLDGWCRGIIYNPSLMSLNPYYGNDVIPKLADDEVIVAGGVYNGNHIEEAKSLNKSIKFYAFEPNEKYASLLEEKYADDSNVIVKQLGLWDKDEMLYFNNAVDVSAMVVTEAEATEDAKRIHAVRMDDEINERVTLIWMDIEGSEQNALRGAERIIRTYRPKLAICIYHKMEDYIEIAEWIKGINPNYRLFVRHHTPFDVDTVLYAI